MPTALSVNLNKIALLRNSREGNYPNIIEFAQQSIAAGAQGITIHPRPDQRHIRPGDVHSLAKLTRQYDDIEFNIEGNPFAAPSGEYPGLLALVKVARPEQVTLVPDSDEQLTSDHGFDLTKDSQRLQPIISQLKEIGVRISLFMDPSIEQIELAKALNVDCIELYTGPYAAEHQKDGSHHTLLSQYKQAAKHALSLGLRVNAGHDLNLHNLEEFLEIAHISEVSIGHALTIDALHMGYKHAVSAYSKICRLQ